MSTAAVQSTGVSQSTGGAPPSTGTAPSTGTGGSTVGAFSWNDGWRDRLAAGSTDPDKERKQLERYESPEQIWKKARELERMVSAGELRRPLKPDATDAEKAQWRKEMGIPDTPKGYKVNMPDGKAPPKEDDAFLNAFLTNAHTANYTQEMVDATIKVFYGEVDRQQRAMEEAEKKAADEAEEKLRQEWGADYKTNKAMAEALLARAPAGFRDRFMNGYLSDHRPIRASVEAWKWLVQMEREINPAATVLPGATGDLGKTIDAELADLKKKMAAPKGSADWKHYWEGPGEARYRELIAARDRMAEKSGQKAA